MTDFDPTAPLEMRAAQALDFAQGQVRALVETAPDYFPLYTENGRWRHGREAWTNWCEGFLGGMMWIFARRTGDGKAVLSRNALGVLRVLAAQPSGAAKMWPIMRGQRC